MRRRSVHRPERLAVGGEKEGARGLVSRREREAVRAEGYELARKEHAADGHLAAEAAGSSSRR